MGSQPTISIPKLVKPGDEVLASDFNKLRNAVMALARGGVAEMPILSTTNTKPNLWVSDVSKDGSNFFVTVSTGYLTYQQLLNQDETDGPVFYLTPTINDISIEDTPAEKITLTGTSGFIYMRSATSNRGVPNATPTIDFYAAEQTSTHHVPESVDANQEPIDGDYYWLLAEFETVPDSDPARPRIKRRLPGDKHVPNQIDRIKNIGDGTKLYWGFDPSAGNALHKIRSLANATESGGAQPLVKSLATEADETVKIKALTAGTGITLSAGANSVEIAADGYEPPDSSLHIQILAGTLTIDFTGTTADFSVSSTAEHLYYRNGVWSTTDDGLGYDFLKNVIGSIGLVVT